MTVDATLIALWVTTAILGVLVWRKGRDRFRAALVSAFQLARMIVVMVPFAIISAGFLGRILPEEWIGALIGEGTGLGGILIASVVGGFVPSGPFVSFPVALTLYNSGAGLVPIIAFMTGWSVFAVHRIVIFELPMMGVRFTVIRLAASLLLPLLTALIAAALFAVMY